MIMIDQRTGTPVGEPRGDLHYPGPLFSSDQGARLGIVQIDTPKGNQLQ